MAKNLVIVESPAKARTIEKYLGRGYKVLASVGHVKDLPGNELAVDVENNFEPKYTVIRGKRKVIDELKKAATSSDNVYLAPDPDREGEAIAWHIANELGKRNNEKIKRVLFTEITKKGVQDGIKNHMPIDVDRVNAQQARRILDRLVGYMVSPLLWKPLKYGLSAGRVQSVALRLICEKEFAIEAFKPEEYWNIDGFFNPTGTDAVIKARLEKKNGKKIKVKNEAEAKQVLSDVEGKPFEISDVVKKEVKQSAPLPFITSKLQQEAARKLSFSAKKTMMVAQRLYEGLELGKEGPVGLITYMRTDSTRVSDDAVAEGRAYVEREYGKEFLSNRKQSKSKKANVQDAHEAIRPTSVERTPDSVKSLLDNDQYRLYKLIWERFVASQMADALYDQSTVLISEGVYEFKFQGKILKFPGFRSIYVEGVDEAEEGNADKVFDVNKGDKLKVEKFDPKQHFTQPPARYTEATLVKTLEAEGIGRPSTYASIISVILDREYVILQEKRFRPTELGRVVNQLLVSNFPNIFETKFTAGLETQLDDVADGEKDWVGVLKEFYGSFEPVLKKAEGQFTSDLTLENKCPTCDSPLTIKYGRNGSFVACTKYPDCSFTSDYERDEEGKIVLVEKEAPPASGVECEKCGAELVFKKTRFGEILACPGYPECKNIKNYIKLPDGGIKILEQGEELKDPCPKCGGGLTVKSGRRGMFIACKSYPTCKFTANFSVDEEGNIVPQVDKVADVNCEKCGKEMVLRKGPRGRFFACSGYPDCKNTKPVEVLEDGTIVAKEKKGK